MPDTLSSPTSKDVFTIFIAKKIYTMDESLPFATAVGVISDRIVAVGDINSMEPWREGRTTVIDRQLADKILLPGFIDNHLHPYLGSILTPTEIIAPEPWRMADGKISPAAKNPEDYRKALIERLAAKPDKKDWFITFGYQPSVHGKLTRNELDAICPDRPVILWQRSFHETYLNSSAIQKLGIPEDIATKHPQIDLDNGHFFETGNKLVVAKLLPYLMQPEWYYKGLKITADLMHQGGVTTAADLVFGSIDPEFELTALDECIEKPKRPLRIVNVCDARSFSNRAVGKKVMGPPDHCPEFYEGLKAIDALQSRASKRVLFSKSVKLFADGAMFSQLMKMKFPGYLDGHHGEWLMVPEVLEKGVQTFWDAGYQLHVHVNGDEGMEAVLSALASAQEKKPRFDHRFMMHHVGFSTNEQSRRMAALGAHASVNPYYIYALADDYSFLGLGPERASQLVRSASLTRNNVRVSFHSDFMMAPIEPLFLAWCAATRTTKSGKVVCPEERISIEQAIRGITIDAAFALHLDHEIGSICAGKKADFTVLDDDPFELGVQYLKDIRIAGTVFEGVVYLRPKSLASSYSTIQLEKYNVHIPPSQQEEQPIASWSHPHRYRPVVGKCCSIDGDPCIFLRQLSAWLQ